MRIAFWTPLPPDPTGIADYSFVLLTALSRLADVTAVVKDEGAGAIAPPAIQVITAREYKASDFDVDVYQMGNHHGFHRYIFDRAFDRPGLVVLHDPALVDFHMAMLGGGDNVAFEEEAAYNLGRHGPLPLVHTDRGPQPDRLALLLCRRLIEVSQLTLVHNQMLCNTMQDRWPDAHIGSLPPLAPALSPYLARAKSAPVTFGIFGGISWHKRVLVVLDAFLRAKAVHPEIRLVIAGRTDIDDPAIVGEIRRRAQSTEAAGAVDCYFDVELEQLEALIHSTDAVVILRWPTAGETSAILMRALAAGRIAITSSLPQYDEFNDEYCRRLPLRPEDEIGAIDTEMQRIAADPQAARTAGRRARSFVEAVATPDRVAGELLSRLRRMPSVSAQSNENVSVNAIASWSSTTGLTEAARRATLALLDTDTQVAIDNCDVGNPSDPSRYPERFYTLATGRPHPIDLCFTNINELWAVSNDRLRVAGHYLIGSWYWELPSVPEWIRPQLRRVDEIWVASEFVRESFRPYTPARIEVLPCVVEPRPPGKFKRSDLGIPDDRCIFLFTFDANSSLARKNPWGTIAAFRQAFTAYERRHNVHLVIKTINLSGLKEAQAALQVELDAVSGTLIDAELSSSELAALVRACDVYVSLHRAEGFGLTLAEAMYFARPVIATAYSGNLTFTNSSNSCLVGYQIREIEPNELRFNPGVELLYEPGQLWAEPDVQQAAWWMRVLYERPTLRERIGLAGQRTVQTRLSSAAIGHAMRRRLLAITRHLAPSDAALLSSPSV